MFDHFSSRTNFGVERRGVGAIIGGVILAAILLTTVLVYFVTILNNEKAKTGYEMLSSQANQERATEKFSVDRNHDLVGGNIIINITNTGSISMNYSHVLLYCVSPACPSTEPAIYPPSVLLTPPPVTMNAGERRDGVGVGPTSNGLTYRIDLISERGNIVSAIECKVNGSICENDPAGGDPEPDPPCPTCPVTEGIIQGTGSLQLDFKAFAALYPQLGSRASVDQRGWEVKVSSKYGFATGYPAFDVQTIQNAATQVVLVEKARNLDPSGEDLTLTRATGLLTSNDQVKGTPPTSNYICKEDKVNKRFFEYNEGTNKVVLPTLPLDALLTDGWTELFFCAPNASDGSGDQINSFWTPANKFSSLNGLFLIARGTFDNINAPYAQTIPYQAVSPGKGNNPDNPLNICLRDGSAGKNPANICPSVTTNCDSPACGASFTDLKYSATIGEMQAGVPIRIHFNNPNGDFPAGDSFKVSWLYPDGKYATVTTFAITDLNAQRNSPTFTLPQTDSDGGTMSCSGAPGTSEYFTIIVTDNFDASANRYTYYMTWRVEC